MMSPLQVAFVLIAISFALGYLSPDPRARRTFWVAAIAFCICLAALALNSMLGVWISEVDGV